MNKYRDISQTSFDFHIKDIDSLRMMYARLYPDVPRQLVRTLKRRELVYLLTKSKFSEKAVDDYFIQCEQWKKYDPLYTEQPL